MNPPTLRSFNWTDHGNAQALASIYGKILKYCPDSDHWYRWTSSMWEIISQGTIRQLALKTAQAQRAAWEEPDAPESSRQAALRYYRAGENRGRMSQTAQVAADLPELQVKFSQFDADLWKIGVLNGEIDLRTGKFSPPNPASFLTKAANVAYDEKATCPRFEKFLGEIFLDNVELLEAMQRICGYFLTGSVEEQMMFMGIGGGANGKSTLFNVLRVIMGDYARMTPFSTFNAASRSEQTNDLASLAGSRLVLISESDEDSFLAEAKLKMATGGDPITCRFLNKEFFTYIPQFKVVMCANQLPGMKGMNDGNFRRPVPIPFDAKFEGSKRVNGLEAMLLEERAGILNWMIEGLMRWQKSKLSVNLPDILVEARRNYRAEMDFVGKWLDECVEIGDPKFSTVSKELFANYVEYARDMNHKPKSHKTWSQEMRTKGFEPIKRNKGMVYLGFKLVNPYEGLTLVKEAA